MTFNLSSIVYKYSPFKIFLKPEIKIILKKTYMNKMESEIQDYIKSRGNDIHIVNAGRRVSTETYYF